VISLLHSGQKWTQSLRVLRQIGRKQNIHVKHHKIMQQPHVKSLFSKETFESTILPQWGHFTKIECLGIFSPGELFEYMIKIF